MTDGRRFRILVVVDDFSRECLCLAANTSISGMRVARELDAIIARRGKPELCVSDNGTELTGTGDAALSVRSARSAGITLRPASRSRMRSRRASSDGGATSV